MRNLLIGKHVEHIYCQLHVFLFLNILPHPDHPDSYLRQPINRRNAPVPNAGVHVAFLQQGGAMAGPENLSNKYGKFMPQKSDLRLHAPRIWANMRHREPPEWTAIH